MKLYTVIHIIVLAKIIVLALPHWEVRILAFVPLNSSCASGITRSRLGTHQATPPDTGTSVQTYPRKFPSDVSSGPLPTGKGLPHYEFVAFPSNVLSTPGVVVVHGLCVLAPGAI